MQVQTIYLDEAGHTGGNLLDSDQPVFVYAALAIDEKSASDICAEVRSRSHTNASELKAGNLLRRERGCAAISWLLENTNHIVRSVVINKEYALAGKFFEYIFEPVLAERNSLFYAIDFHKFVAMVLYIHVKAGHSYARDILENFQRMARDTDPSLLESVLSAEGFAMPEEDPLTDILTFALCHQEQIKSEVRTLTQINKAPSWVLELSTTAVHNLLASWGEEFESLRVYCDQSKPIAADLSWFENFIGREDKFYVPFGKHPSPSLIYNLETPVNLVDSKQYEGVQIADIWASTLAYALNHQDNKFSEEWLALAENSIINAIYPDTDLIDPNQHQMFINWHVLKELKMRSVYGKDLLGNL